MNEINEIAEMLILIDKVQEGQDLTCGCKECYWNMWSPNPKYNNAESLQCISESLADFKMTPNSTKCKGYWSYEEACGKKKA